jgi:hypothetical protein
MTWVLWGFLTFGENYIGLTNLGKNCYGFNNITKLENFGKAGKI